MTALRGAAVRVEQRLDGSLAVSFQGRVLRFEPCLAAVKNAPPPAPDRPAKPRRPPMNSARTPWGKNYDRMKDIPIGKAAKARG